LPCCTAHFGARESAALHKNVAALHQFPPILPIILAQVAEKRFKEIQDDLPLKLK
jgi:hypothetical protein